MGAVMERYEYEYNSVERVILTWVLYLAIFSLKIPRLWLDRDSLPGKLSIVE
jgi:hypothetical protein